MHRYIIFIIIIISFLISSYFDVYGLENKKESLPSETKNANAYLNLFIHYRLKNLDSALHFATLAHEMARSEGDSLMAIRGEYAVGWVYQHKGLYTQAESHYVSALRSARINGFREREEIILNGLGILNYTYGNYDDALKYYFESLKLRELSDNQGEMAVVCNNIGLVYYAIKDVDQAIVYFKRALSLSKGDGIEETLTNLGLCFSYKERHDLAIEYYENVLAYCTDGCPSKILVEAYNGAGISYFIQKENEVAKDKFTKAIRLATTEDLKSQRVISYHYLGRIEMIEENLEEALTILARGQKIALEINYRVWINKNAKLFGEIYSLLGRYELAYEFQKRYDSLNSLILNEEVIQNLAKIQINHQERENLETISLQRSELTRRTILLSLSLIIIILAVIILVILFRNNQHRRKVNSELSAANDIIEEQNHELMNMNNVLEEKVRERTRELNASNTALLKSNTELDNFIYKTSHDIRGPLATLQGVCNVALMDIKDKQAIDYFQKLGKTAARLNEILSKLLVINQINNSMISQERIDFHELISEQLSGQGGVKTAKQIEIKQEIQSGLDFRSDSELLKIILKNLINNAFKFHNTSSRVHSFVHVIISRCKNDLAILITDNGIGIEENVSSKIFEIFSKASDIADTAGLGLYLVKLAVEKLRGEINLSKTQCGHTQFEVRLPYN